MYLLCRVCGEQKPKDAFNRRSKRCKECSARESERLMLIPPQERQKFIQRKSNIKRTYGLSYESWIRFWESQGGLCKICGKKFNELSDAHTDHSHSTGVVRGLLCFRCNMGIGNFKDDVGLLKKAIEYLSERGR